jgi:3-oxoacyl-[acyl-carrier protein] reductase
MDLGIAGKTALVTGGSKGLGLGIARALAGEGVRVAVTSRSLERATAAAESIGARAYEHDNSAVDRADALVDAVERDLGPVDILVTNTGGPPVSPDPLSFGQEQWEAAYRELVIAPMALIKRIVPAMRERGFGRVLTVAASGTREPAPPLILSNAHRSGMLAASKMLARQVAGDGVTINSILPGLIGTDRLLGLWGGNKDAERATIAAIPAGRLGTVDELAAVAAFLCSASASYVTGAAVLVDGGLTQSV